MSVTWRRTTSPEEAPELVNTGGLGATSYEVILR